MWKLIVKKRMPPTRIVRYCCGVFKEGHGNGRIVILGLRKAESHKRSKRKMLEGCNKPNRNMVYFSPIIHWSTSDVWEYIQKYNVPYCSLYDEGHKRIGCIMCPMSGRKGMQRDAERWPKYYQNYLRAFEHVIENKEQDGRKYKINFQNAQEMMAWWINGRAITSKLQLCIDFSSSFSGNNGGKQWQQKTQASQTRITSQNISTKG